MAKRDGQQGISLISPLGGPERRLGGISGGQLSWSPDGKYLIAGAGGRTSGSSSAALGALHILPVEGGDARVLLRPEAGESYVAPDVHPSGRWLGFIACAAKGCEVRVASLNADLTPGSERRTLTPRFPGGSSLRWSPGEEALIWSGFVGQVTYLWRADLDGGGPRRLEIAGDQATGFGVARRGNRAAFVRRTENYDIWAMDERGSSRPLLASNLPDASGRYSLDGRKIVFVTQRGGEAQQIWLANSDGSGQAPLTSTPGTKGSPAWSADGKWIAFDSQDPATGLWQTWVIDSAGGTARPLTKLPGGASAPSWSRDGKHVYAAVESNGRLEVFRIPSGGGAGAERVTSAGGALAQESPDGETLFYTRTLGMDQALYAMPLGGGAETKVLDSVFFRSFDVFNDGVYYLVRTPDRQIEARFHAFAGGRDRVFGAVRGGVLPYLSVSPDRKTMLFSHSPQSGSDLMLIENFR